jgi:RNA polymerase sigma-70 factor (ECF subfamily)
MTLPVEERRLILAARKGSEEAFREIVERNHARLYEVVFRIVRHRADAEEVTQETFLRAYKNLDRFAFDSALYTWLYRIAVNAAVDLAKRRKRRSHVSLDNQDSPLAASIPSDGPPPAAGGERSEMVALVREGIAALPEPFRSILVMREYGDLSYEQLAETLAVPKGTVESRLFRARMRLRDWLVERLGADGARDLLPEGI